MSMNVLKKLITAMSLCQSVSILKDLTFVPVLRKAMHGMKVPALVKNILMLNLKCTLNTTSNSVCVTKGPVHTT